MTVIRSVLFNVYFFSTHIAMLLVMWLLLPLPRSVMQGAVRFWARLVRWGLRWIVGIDCRVEGRENIPQGGALIASKHQSAWDTFVYYLILGDPVYVLKKELLSIPFWGWYARKAEAVAVDRKAGARALKDMLRDCQAALDKGRQVIIFPEGTRTAPGDRRPYQPGVAALYARINAPVVPVALNTGVFWGRRSFVKRPGTMVLSFLPPIPAGLDRQAFQAELESRVEAESARLVAAAPADRVGARLIDAG